MLLYYFLGTIALVIPYILVIGAIFAIIICLKHKKFGILSLLIAMIIFLVYDLFIYNK